MTAGPNSVKCAAAAYRSPLPATSATSRSRSRRVLCESPVRSHHSANVRFSPRTVRNAFFRVFRFCTSRLVTPLIRDSVERMLSRGSKPYGCQERVETLGPCPLVTDANPATTPSHKIRIPRVRATLDHVRPCDELRSVRTTMTARWHCYPRIDRSSGTARERDSPVMVSRTGPNERSRDDKLTLRPTSSGCRSAPTDGLLRPLPA